MISALRLRRARLAWAAVLMDGAPVSAGRDQLQVTLGKRRVSET